MIYWKNWDIKTKLIAINTLRMKRCYTLFGLFLMCGFIMVAQQPMKFGHVNSQEIFQAMPELKTIETTLESEFSSKESQLGTMQKDLQTKQEAYMNEAQTLSQETRIAKEQELQELSQKIQNFYMLAQQQLKSKEQELKMPLYQKVQTAIQEVGDEGGFLYIFELGSGMPVFHSEKSVDVAPLVKAKLGIN